MMEKNRQDALDMDGLGPAPILQSRVKVPDYTKQDHWMGRFIVLWGYSLRSTARLEVFPDEDSFRLHQSYRASACCTYLENIVTVEAMSHDSVPHVIIISRKSELPFTFATQSESDHVAWVTTLNRELTRGVAETLLRHQITTSKLPSTEDVHISQNDPKIRVRICETSISQSCQLLGEYNLLVTRTALVLCTKAGDTVTVWHYKHVRRYGRSKRHFFFESGSKCSLGQGWWKLTVDIGGETLFKLVSDKTSLTRMEASSFDDPYEIIDHEDVPPPRGHGTLTKPLTRDGYVVMSKGSSPVVNNYASVDSVSPRNRLTYDSVSSEDSIYVLPGVHEDENKSHTGSFYLHDSPNSPKDTDRNNASPGGGKTPMKHHYVSYNTSNPNQASSRASSSAASQSNSASSPHDSRRREDALYANFQRLGQE